MVPSVPHPAVRTRVVRLVVVVAAALAALTAYRRLTPAPDPAGIVRASGAIEATETDVAPRAPGRIARILVDEGSHVRAGDVIAEIDAPELVEREAQAEAASRAANARYADLAAGARPETLRDLQAALARTRATAEGARRVATTADAQYARSSELRAALASARSALEAAVKQRDAVAARLRIVRDGPRVEEREQLQAALEQARAVETNAGQELRRTEALYREGAVAANQMDRARAALDTAQAATRAAEARTREARAGARPDEIAEAEARMASAEAVLAGARQTASIQETLVRDRLQARQGAEAARATAASTARQVASAQAQLDLARSGATVGALEVARAQAAQAAAAASEARTARSERIVRAPTDGVVTVRYREPGEIVTAGAPLVRIANLRTVWLRVYAPLTQLGRIRPGQDATVTTDTMADRRYPGRIASVREEPEFTPKSVQTAEERVKLVFGIRISVENPAGELKPGMPADAEIRVAGPAR